MGFNIPFKILPQVFYIWSHKIKMISTSNSQYDLNQLARIRARLVSYYEDNFEIHVYSFINNSPLCNLNIKDFMIFEAVKLF